MVQPRSIRKNGFPMRITGISMPYVWKAPAIRSLSQRSPGSRSTTARHAIELVTSGISTGHGSTAISPNVCNRLATKSGTVAIRSLPGIAVNSNAKDVRTSAMERLFPSPSNASSTKPLRSPRGETNVCGRAQKSSRPLICGWSVARTATHGECRNTRIFAEAGGDSRK